MDESTKQTVEKYEGKLVVIEAQARKIKVAINGLYELEGEVAPYPEVESDGQDAGTRRTTIRPDQFYGRPLATVVREVLNWRVQRQEGAISLDELFATMIQGGFEFEGRDEVSKKRTLAITIGKNPAFVRVPNSGHIGIAEWYPNAKKKPSQSSNGNTVQDEAEAAQEAGEKRQEEERLAAQEAAATGE